MIASFLIISKNIHSCNQNYFVILQTFILPSKVMLGFVWTILEMVTWELLLLNLAGSYVMTVLYFQIALNEENGSWTKLTKESDPLVLSALLWDWIDHLRVMAFLFHAQYPFLKPLSQSLFWVCLIRTSESNVTAQ